MEDQQLSMQTAALHSHQKDRKDPYGSHLEPIYATSTFMFDDSESGRRLFAGEEGGASHTYSRIANPTVEALEHAFRVQECFGLGIDPASVDAMVFASGMSAITTAMLSVAKGGHILAQDTVYGCTHEFLSNEAGQMGMEVRFADIHNTDYFLEALFNYPEVDLVYLETMANPTLQVVDIPKIIDAAHKAGALVMIDNTFATPALFQPLGWGADLVVYSTTKYQNGMGTSLGGVVLSRLDEEKTAEMHTWRKNLGGIAGSFDAWLTLQGLKTLPLRMELHSRNAQSVAEFLMQRDEILNVNYPGLRVDEDEHLTKMFTNGFGGVVAFEVEDYETAVQIMDSVKLCTRAVSLGHPDTLIQHPASMTHAVVPKEEREATGITDGLIRISVGLEDSRDIIQDLKQAIESVKTLTV